MTNGKIKISYYNIVLLFASVFTIMPNYLVIGDYTVKNLLIISFAFLHIIFIRHVKINARDNRPMLIALMLEIIVLSTIAVLHGRVSIAIMKLLQWGVVFFFLIDNINTKQRFLKLIDVLIYTAGIVSILGIVDEIMHINLFWLLNNSGSNIVNMGGYRMGLQRILSFTSHSITYCIYCMFILGLIFYRLSLPNCKRKRVFRLIYASVLLNAVFTVSRGPLICLVFSQFLLLWFCGYRKFFLRSLQIIMIVSGIVLFLYFFSEETRRIVQVPFVMLMAIFNEDYVSTLRMLGFEGNNTNGFGQRFQLYAWVWEEIQGHKLLGYGPTSVLSRYFINSAGYMQLKESIEVQILRTLYRYGFLGMFSEMIMFVSMTLSSMKFRRKGPALWEGNLSFSSMAFSLLISYILVLFGVMQNEDEEIFFFLIILLSAYIANHKFESC